MTSFRLTPDDYTALEAIETRDGITVGEQIRRGIRLWLQQKAREHRVLDKHLPKKVIPSRALAGVRITEALMKEGGR